MKHEGAEAVINGDGRVVVYMGDDERFDYVYKFVSAGTYNEADRAANMTLLDEGTLYVARYDADGKGAWLPLTHGEGPLTEENGFPDQATVLIQARLAGDALGATKMDRPEDISAGRDGSIFVMLTNNTRRKAEQVDAANPRADNKFGHIVEMRAPDGDHAATDFTWDILVQCGDPSVAEVGATFSAETTPNGWFGMPDNCVIDAENRLWISTDGNSAEDTGRADGLWALSKGNDGRATSVHFFRCPSAANCADRSSRPTPSRCSLPSSIRRKAATTGRNLAASRPSTIRPRAGPTSRKAGPHAPPWWSSPSRAAAKSPADENEVWGGGNLPPPPTLVCAGFGAGLQIQTLFPWRGRSS
jgi:secreted PhoX family phosphatase